MLLRSIEHLMMVQIIMYSFNPILMRFHAAFSQTYCFLECQSSINPKLSVKIILKTPVRRKCKAIETDK